MIPHTTGLLRWTCSGGITLAGDTSLPGTGRGSPTDPTVDGGAASAYGTGPRRRPSDADPGDHDGPMVDVAIGGPEQGTLALEAGLLVQVGEEPLLDRREGLAPTRRDDPGRVEEPLERD